ncbi:site-specific DNA-methyltransferase [Lactonifactor longoviformis]|uniref:site-specific DNA-methyltransferase n=1 Tax=Lactonifactor longoviformis TaxID=341220 RepID=UPI0036F1B074
MQKTAQLKVLPVGVLRPAAYNPRKKLKPGDKEYEKIKNSITEFGFADPLVVNADMTIIGGHQRLTVAMDLGYTEVPCAVVDIDKVREKALNIALNKITGAWDDSLLADLLKDIENSDFDLGKTGFDPPEIETLFNKVHSKEVREDDFDVESELKRPAFSRSGDLWMLGRHRVYCGDSTLPESYGRLLEKMKVNLVLSDLPYFVAYQGTAGTIQNDDLPDYEAYDFTLKAMQCMFENLADDGSIYIFHADTKGLIFRKAFDAAGFYLSGCCIWKKNALVLGRSPYQWMHEPCLFGWKKDGKHQWYSDRKQTTIWEYDRPKANKDHPTMKPVGLMSYPIRNSTMTNGIVLDPFLGSGSTLVACEETDRVCMGIELETKFVDVIVKRYIELKDGNASDVYVIRDGQKLSLDEVVQLDTEDLPSGEQAATESGGVLE